MSSRFGYLGSPVPADASLAAQAGQYVRDDTLVDYAKTEHAASTIHGAELIPLPDGSHLLY